MSEEETYMVIRHFRDWRPSKPQRKGLTLEEAQELCQRDDASGDGWADEYKVEES